TRDPPRSGCLIYLIQHYNVRRGSQAPRVPAVPRRPAPARRGRSPRSGTLQERRVDDRGGVEAVPPRGRALARVVLPDRLFGAPCVALGDEPVDPLVLLGERAPDGGIAKGAMLAGIPPRPVDLAGPNHPDPPPPHP